jgi:hypothetical protein
MASLDEYSEYQYLENILKDAIFGHIRVSKQKTMVSNKYDQVNNIQMKDYKYNDHLHKKD